MAGKDEPRKRDTAPCPHCAKQITVNPGGGLHAHSTTVRCPGSNTPANYAAGRRYVGRYRRPAVVDADARGGGVPGKVPAVAPEAPDGP